MTFRRIALRNIVHNWHRYGAYFLSCVFSVMIFFVYLSFIVHPEVEANRLPEGSTVSALLILCEFLIFMFSIFFIWYSNMAFMSSRKQEYGLFSLFGMSKWQLRRVVFEEQLLISVLSIVTGIGSGLIVTKLFYMVMGYMLRLDEPLPFYVSLRAILMTSVLFLLLFMSITLLSLLKVGRTQIVNLIRGQRAAKREPHFSWLLAVFGICSVIAGYVYAVKTNNATFNRTAGPTFFWTILGTYFLCTQFSVFFIKMLSRNKRIYYYGTNLLNISKAAYRIRANARMLFAISILCTVVMSATGTVFVFDKGYRNMVEKTNPFELTVQQPFGEQPPITTERVHELAEQNNVVINGEAVISLIEGKTGSVENNQYAVSLINVSDYNRLAVLLELDLIEPLSEEIYLFTQEQSELLIYSGLDQIMVDKEIEILVGSEKKSYTWYVEKQINETLLSQYYSGPSVLVLPDAVFQQVAQQSPPETKYQLYNYKWEDWEQTLPFTIAINVEVDDNFRVESRLSSVHDVSQMSSLVLFIGVFISLLFFIASGSIISFKLFSDLQEDQQYYRSLLKLGLSMSEIRHVVHLQVGIIFLMPCIIGSIHTMFAMVTLSHLLLTNIMWYAFGNVALYCIFQYIYFLITRAAYMKQIKKRIGITYE